MMPAAALCTEPPAEGRTDGNEARILVVDDHPANLLAMEAALSDLREPLQQASSGREALALLERQDFAVILLDVQMPDLTGFDVAQRLRAQGRQTPIIFLTAGQADARQEAVGYDRGAVDFLVKPFDAAVLRAKVRTFLQLYRQREALERLTALHARDRLVAHQRIQALAAVSEKLSSWLDTDAVAQVVITEAHDVLGAKVSLAFLLSSLEASEAPSPQPLGAEGVLELAACRGVDSHWLSRLERVPLSSPLPIVQAVRTGEAIWIGDRTALLRAYPELDAEPPRGLERTEALVALPLGSRAEPFGVIVFCFDQPRSWDAAEREFFITLVGLFTSALARTRLISAERKAMHALAEQARSVRLMADVTTLLASSLDYEAALGRLTQRLVPALADWCAVDVLDERGRVVRITMHHSDPEKIALARDLEARYPADPDARHGVSNVLRTGQSEWMATIPDSLLAAAARDEEHLRLVRQLGLKSYMAVPIQARGRLLGALSLVYAESNREYSERDVRFVEELAARAALSLDNALLFKDQVDARQRLARQSGEALLVGDVGAALTGSETLREGLQRCAEALVRRLDAAFARIWTVDTRGKILELQASAGLYTHLDGPHARVPIGHLKIGRIARDGAPHLTNDVQGDPWVGDPEWARREGMVAFAGYPLVIEGKVIGVLALFARQRLADDTLSTLAAIADSIAVAIERGRSDERAREERDTLEVVNEVGRALAAELDREKLVQAVTDAATRLAGAAFGAFFYNVMDAAGESYMLYAVAGVAREEFSKFPMPRNTRVFAPTFAGEGIVRVDDIRQDPRYGHNAPHHGMPEGHLPVASYLAVPVVSRSGAVIGGLFFGHPAPGVFTERSQMLVSGVAAQAAIAMDNARLFSDAQRLIAQLDKSNKELDQFAYVASHDLKAPLRGIANLSQWLEEDLGDAISDENKQQLELMRSRVHRMEGLINGILEYSRAGRVRTKPELVAVQRLLSEVIELSAAPAGARIEVGAGMPALRTERVPLQQVFMNLIGNALKHAKRADPIVRVEVRDAGESFEFSISDNGPGIAPEFHERIWGIFQTLDPRDTVESTGIGLSVVRKIVENKGGRTWVESQEGHGAVFRFTWPKAEPGKVNDV
jgi:GAF domain-containing protein/FixJ family two-component response regulator/two-component sensor histidine kinase